MSSTQNFTLFPSRGGEGGAFACYVTDIGDATGGLMSLSAEWATEELFLRYVYVIERVSVNAAIAAFNNGQFFIHYDLGIISGAAAMRHLELWQTPSASTGGTYVAWPAESKLPLRIEANKRHILSRKWVLAQIDNVDTQVVEMWVTGRYYSKSEPGDLLTLPNEGRALPVIN